MIMKFQELKSRACFESGFLYKLFWLWSVGGSVGKVVGESVGRWVSGKWSVGRCVGSRWVGGRWF